MLKINYKILLAHDKEKKLRFQISGKMLSENGTERLFILKIRVSFNYTNKLNKFHLENKSDVEGINQSFRVESKFLSIFNRVSKMSGKCMIILLKRNVFIPLERFTYIFLLFIDAYSTRGKITQRCRRV